MITLDEKEFAYLKNKVDSEQFNKIIDDVLMKAGFKVENTATELISKRATNTGRLLQSVGVAQLPNHQVVVFTNVDYAPDVEEGTKPHTAPLDDIIEWARLKFQLNDKEARETGARVWEKIKKYGTKGKFFWRDTYLTFNLDRYVDMLKQNWEKE
jgi:hypothetical protein